MVEFKKVRKKPVVVEAFQLTEELCKKYQFDEKGFLRNFDIYLAPCDISSHSIAINNQKAVIGEWVILDTYNLIYIMKNSIFRASYDILEE